MKAKDTALIVIDTQQGVVEGAYRADRTVANVAAAVERARMAGVPVVWVQHEDEALAKGSEAWRLAGSLEAIPGETLIGKKYNSSFEETGLHAFLGSKGIRTLVIAGAASNWCVRATAYLELEGGRTIPAEDLIADLNATIRWIEYPGRTTQVIPAGDLAFD